MRRPPRFDALLALALTVFGQVEVWSLRPADVPGPHGVQAALLLVATAAVAWRRIWPSPAAALAMGALLASSLAWDMPDVMTAMFVLVIAPYSAAVHAPLRPALAALGLGVAHVAAVLDDEPSDGALEFIQNLVFLLIFITGPWVVGRAVRRRHLRAEAEGERATAAELRARTAVAEERVRIARELHDVVGHCLSVIVMQAAVEKRLQGERSSDALDTIERTGREALTEMRRLLGMLQRGDEEVALAPQPSLRHLDELLERVCEAGLPVRLVVEGDMRDLPAGVDLSAYRIVQEALTNALKHAGPASAQVTIRYGASEVEVEVVDDGRGEGDGGGTGLGLTGMRERVAVYGGSLRSGPRRDGGYAVRVTLPTGADT